MEKRATKSEWVDALLGEFFNRMHVRETDNFDHQRFSENREDEFLLDYHRANLKFFFEHQDDLFRTWDRLANQESKELFDLDEMKELFNLGYSQAIKGYQWKKTPPGLEEDSAGN